MPKKVEPKSACGRRMVELRKARGLTQTQLAEAIGSSQRAISSYETVADFPPTPVIIKLAKALSVSSDDLLGIQRGESVRKPFDAKTKRVWKKFQQLQKLPEKDQKAVIRLINSLISVTKAA